MGHIGTLIIHAAVDRYVAWFHFQVSIETLTCIVKACYQAHQAQKLLDFCEMKGRQPDKYVIQDGQNGGGTENLVIFDRESGTPLAKIKTINYASIPSPAA